MTTFLATMLALHFLARHSCVCENPSCPLHGYISGHHVGLTFSYQDMAVCVKKLYTLIMTTFLDTILALHFVPRHSCACENTLYSYHHYISGHHDGLEFLFQDMAVSENALYPHHDYISGHHVDLTFSCKTWLKCF